MEEEEGTGTAAQTLQRQLQGEVLEEDTLEDSHCAGTVRDTEVEGRDVKLWLDCTVLMTNAAAKVAVEKEAFPSTASFAPAAKLLK